MPLVSPRGAWAQDGTPPRRVLRWISGYRPAPWGTVMQPTCHMFLIHLEEDFCALGFPTWGLGPRWYTPRGLPRWVSGYKPALWGKVMQPTCHMFLIHLVEDSAPLLFPPGAWSQYGTLLGGAEMGLGL